MRTMLRSPSIQPTEIDGQSPSPKDKFVRRRFGKVCKDLWDKPDVEIAIIEGCDPRTARRILRGEGKVSWDLMLAVCQRMLEPID